MISATSTADRLRPFAGASYALAALLVVLPLLDYTQNVGAPQLGNVQWRFASVGLLSSYLVTPLLGASLAVGTAAVLEHRTARRILGYGCMALAILLVLMLLGFVLDVIQLRHGVPTEGRRGFDAATARAGLKHLLGAVVAFSFGQAAIKGERGERRQRSEKGAIPLVNR
ncbi:MAG TPA: hypothetical protein VNL96_08630 [Gemmatimonadaceae bacterium]|nr:hypothetical protein [Gemmatimonadaceae bacterium]